METDSLGRDGSSTPKGRRGGGDALTSEEMVTLLAWSHGLAPATADLAHVHVRDLTLSKLVWHGSQSRHPLPASPKEHRSSQPSRCLHRAVDGCRQKEGPAHPLSQQLPEGKTGREYFLNAGVEMQEPLPVRAGDPESDPRIVSVFPTDSALIRRLRAPRRADGAWPESQATLCSLSQNQPCSLVPYCLLSPACASLPRTQLERNLAQREDLAF